MLFERFSHLWHPPKHFIFRDPIWHEVNIEVPFLLPESKQGQSVPPKKEDARRLSETGQVPSSTGLIQEWCQWRLTI